MFSHHILLPVLLLFTHIISQNYVGIEAAEDDYDEYDEDVDEGDENMEKNVL